MEVENGLLKPIIKGDDISRYRNLSNQYFVIFPYILENNNAEPMREKYIQENESSLRNREKGKINKEFFMGKADKMLDLNKTFQTQKTKFLNRMKDNFDLEKLSKKLEAFYKSDFKTFLKELKKKKVTLTLKDQDEGEEYFDSYKTELTNLQTQIDNTDTQIDAMVYSLYGLSEDEVAVVEGHG